MDIIQAWYPMFSKLHLNQATINNVKINPSFCREIALLELPSLLVLVIWSFFFFFVVFFYQPNKTPGVTDHHGPDKSSSAHCVLSSKKRERERDTHTQRNKRTSQEARSNTCPSIN
jgi:hypothetical protein